jgi:hypothetical protein
VEPPKIIIDEIELEPIVVQPEVKNNCQTNFFKGESEIEMAEYSDEIIYKHNVRHLQPFPLKRNVLKSIAEESSQDYQSSLPSCKHSEEVDPRRPSDYAVLSKQNSKK